MLLHFVLMQHLPAQGCIQQDAGIAPSRIISKQVDEQRETDAGCRPECACCSHMHSLIKRQCPHQTEQCGRQLWRLHVVRIVGAVFTVPFLQLLFAIHSFRSSAPAKTEFFPKSRIVHTVCAASNIGHGAVGALCVLRKRFVTACIV